SPLFCELVVVNFILQKRLPFLYGFFHLHKIFYTLGNILLFYSNFILIVAILLLLNIWIFDRSRNASIGFRTKRSLSSKKNWVYSQTIFYGGIVLISLLSSTLYSLNIIDVSTSNSISIIGIIIDAIITQLFLVFRKKKRSKK